MPVDQAFSGLLTTLQTNLIPNAIQVMIYVSPLILAFLLGKLFWELWMDYIRSAQFLGLKYICLELKLPKETFKSPMAMEVFLSSIHNVSDGSNYAQFWKGETRPWYSLELISIEGQVKFIIWLEDRRKVNLMGALYSQFPGIEVREIEDYTRSVHFDPKKMRIWAAEMKLDKSDPWPIRTYVEFGLDKDPKEELKVDPLLPLMEFLGSAGPNTQLWIQIIIRAHTDDQRIPGTLFKKGDLRKIRQVELIDEILKRDPKTKVSGIKNEQGFIQVPTFTKGEQDAVAALERGLYKKQFDVGIRCLYISTPEQFSTPYGVGGFIGGFSVFGGGEANTIKGNKDKWHMRLGDPWKDYKNFRRNLYAKLALMAYKRRSYFYPPFPSKPFVLNVEELATIYHFPGSVSQLPTLERVPSKKAQAPTNLPV